tara:strand:- start:1898 stop:2092 length:195 start_codon:yes stop_codon:yes gene_type:complete
LFGLRHGFTWRAHKESENPLTVRDCSAFRGHDPTTHLKHYGRWGDEIGLKEAAPKFKKGQQVAA